jgi:hypothetical protein
MARGSRLDLGVEVTKVAELDDEGPTPMSRIRRITHDEYRDAAAGPGDGTVPPPVPL